MVGGSSGEMKAARFYEHHDVRIDSVPKPVPKKDEVIVHVSWSGICGTDLHEYSHGPVVINPKHRPHPISGDTLPMTMGHEFCGHVVSAVPDGALSAQGTPIKTGDAVVIDPRIICNDCFPCRDGNENTCVNWGFLGLNSAGGFASEVAVKSSMCHILPSDMPLDHAALIEPLAVGRHALELSDIPITKWKDLSALVIGGGPVGLAVLCNLRVAGATRVYVSEPSAKRREQTKAWAKEVFNPIETNIPEACKADNGGRGVDIVFDCAGVVPGMTAGLNSLRSRGIYVNIASWETEFKPSAVTCTIKELTVKFSLAYDKNDFRNVVQDFIEGKFKGAESMITGRVALEDLVQKGFERLINDKDHHVKIIVTPKKELIATAT